MSEFSESKASQETKELITLTSDYEDESGHHPSIEIDQNAPALFLFDIDGTMIDARKLHGPAQVALYKEKFNLQGLDEPKFREEFIQFYVDQWGKGEKEEQAAVCDHYGITFASDEERDRILEDLATSYGHKFEQVMADATPEMKANLVLPGVKIFLERMQREGIPAAVVTGNVQRSARAILKHTGLAKYFITGGHDDDPAVTSEGYRRANIVNSAIEKLKAKGIDISPERMAVFGDTPKDYLATLHQLEGKPFVFLLATGDVRFHDLAKVKNPDNERRPYLVLPKLSDLNLDKFFESLRRETSDE